jgi:hypothetical protein
VLETLAEKVLTLQAGAELRPVFNLVDVAAEGGNDLILVYGSDDLAVLGAGMDARAWVEVRLGQGGAVQTIAAPHRFEARPAAGALPRPYRGWSFGAYKGYASCEQQRAVGELGPDDPCSDAPLDPAHFQVAESLNDPAQFQNDSETEGYDQVDQLTFAPVAGDGRSVEPHWFSAANSWGIGPVEMTASRQGREVLDFPAQSSGGDAPPAAGAVGVERLSLSQEGGFSVGIYINLSNPSSGRRWISAT